ncbi:MAG: J domain-containing protein [Sediminibacterium sp.]|nr:J domain-containing protein [Sediminibacterium sp.]
MHLHNWYAVLSVSPTASDQEIRQTYRKLAHQYHPDKNPGNDQSSLHFQLIKEAYEVLSSPKRRSAYDRLVYLGNPVQHTPEMYHTPAELTAAANRLYQQLMQENEFFINRDWLMAACMELLSAENRQMLQQSSSEAEKTAFLTTLFQLSYFLTYRQNRILASHWQPISNGYATLESLALQYLQRKKNEHLWDKYKIWIAIAVGILFTIFIVLS